MNSLGFKYKYILMYDNQATGINKLDDFLGIENIPSQRDNDFYNQVLANVLGKDINKISSMSNPWLGFLNSKGEEIFGSQVGGIRQEFEEFYSVTPESPTEDETKEEETTEKPTSNENMAKLFDATISIMVNKILEGYEKLFASGFDLKRPVGILGDGVIYSLSGNELVTESYDPLARASKPVIMDKLDFIISEDRSISKIVNTVIANPDKKFYFPLKMVEYAFGREIGGTDNVNGRTNYGNISKYRKWSDYAKYEIKPNLEGILMKVCEGYLKDKEEISMEEEEFVKKKLLSLVDVFLSCVVLSEGNSRNPDVVRVKIYNPYSTLNGNIATQLAEKAFGDVGGKKSLSQNPEIDGYYTEYVHEVNHILYNAEPLFAYKAAQALREQGKPINRFNMLIGLQDGDKILPLGKEGISLEKSLSHLIVAGSRAGKGLQTLLILANALISGTPIFYLDNKPDMASLVKWLNPRAFAVNGSDVTTNKAEGTDYFEMFRNPNGMVRPDTPEYVKKQFGGTYSDLGNFYYVRALTLALSVIALRVKAPELLDNLGGENGIIIVVDELRNTSNNFNSMLQVDGITNYARYGYYQEYINYLMAVEEWETKHSEWLEGDQKGAEPKKPKEPDIKPDKGAYWFAAFYHSLSKSVERLQALNNAGLRNSEVKKSDVFVLSQVLHNPTANTSELFAPRNKNSNSRGGDISTNDVIASLAMIGNTDGFVGYNADKPAYLAQDNPNSNAYGKLDQYARNFAYVPSVVANNKTLIEKGNLEYANKAVYYKPFLMLSDGAEEGYFLQNSLNYAESAGINPKEIIERNEDPNRAGHIDPRIGFKEYLLDNGMTEQSIVSTLDKAGNIANYVVQNILNYGGTWEDFIFDLRPEWIFSIEDVLYAYDNGKPRELKERLSEFTAVYPEEFGISPDDVLPRDVENENFDTDLFTEDKFDDIDFDFTDTDADEVINQFDEEDTPTNEDGTQESFSEPIKQEQEQFEDAEKLVFGVTPKEYKTYPMNEAGIKSLMTDITDTIIANQGGEFGVETWVDRNGVLIVNGAVVRLEFPERSLVALPHHYQRKIKNNLYGELFDYSRFINFYNLSEISFSNKYSLREMAVVCGNTSKAIEPSVWFFKKLKGLRQIECNGKIVKRNELENEVESSKFGFSYGKSGASVVAESCSNARKQSWGYTKSLPGRQDLGIGSKIFLGVLSGVAGLGLGVIGGTASIGKGIKDWFSAMKEVSKGGNSN